VLPIRDAFYHPGCFLIDQLLLPNKPALEFLESVCTGYLGVVTDRGKAVEKIYDECKGQTKSSVDDFDGRLMDLLAKPAVVYLLYQKKMSRFRPIGRAPTPTPDYECDVMDDDGNVRSACLEIKNVRAPLGLTHVIRRKLMEVAAVRPWFRSVGFTTSHYWDNTATQAHINAITAMVYSFQEEEIPGPKTLLLPMSGDAPRWQTLDSEMRVEVEFSRSSDKPILYRRLGGHLPIGPFRDAKAFLCKVSDTVSNGISQLASCSCQLKVLAVNISTPDYTLPDDWALRVKEMVYEESEGRVECLVSSQFKTFVGLGLHFHCDRRRAGIPAPLRTQDG
jgi:hypothetical protein